eukprot:m.78436 g.78436  ORF g.78436 m.78436 type:complete len:67 (+) comp36100_c0_seq24:1682-1882(+)
MNEMMRKVATGTDLPEDYVKTSVLTFLCFLTDFSLEGERFANCRRGDANGVGNHQLVSHSLSPSQS